MSFFARVAGRGTAECDRGVTVVEYALIIGTVVVGSLSSFGALDASVGTHYAATADDIGQPDLLVFDVTTTTSGVAGGSTTTTTAAAAASTTTTTASAASATTTTTAAAPATTAAPTTTTTSGSLALHSAESKCEDESFKWEGSDHAKIVMEFDDEDGHDLEDAEVEVEFKLKDGKKGKAKGKTNSWGRVAFEWDWLDEADFDIEVKVVKIEKRKDDKHKDEYEHQSSPCKLSHD